MNKINLKAILRIFTILTAIAVLNTLWGFEETLLTLCAFIYLKE